MSIRLPCYLALLLFVAEACGQDIRPVTSGREFQDLHVLICPDPGELKARDLPFVGTLREARQMSKPILLLGSQGNGLAISRG